MSFDRRSPHRVFWFVGSFLFLAVTLPAVWFASSTSAVAWQQIDVTGVWNMRVEAPEGIATPTIDLLQDGEKISGTYSGQMGKTRLEGVLKGGTIQFSITLKFQDRSYLISYSGTVTGNAMTGTAQFGDSGTGRWTAQRNQK